MGPSRSWERMLGAPAAVSSSACRGGSGRLAAARAGGLVLQGCGSRRCRESSRRQKLRSPRLGFCRPAFKWRGAGERGRRSADGISWSPPSPVGLSGTAHGTVFTAGSLQGPGPALPMARTRNQQRPPLGRPLRMRLALVGRPAAFHPPAVIGSGQVCTS